MRDLFGDINRFWEAYNDVREQTWSAPHDILYGDAFSRLLLFKAERPNGQAVLLNTPRAGHHSNIGQPLALVLADMGFDVYAIDHLEATQETKDFGLDEICDAVNKAWFCLNCSDYGGVHLVGLCQGGWATAIWAALNPDAGYDSLTIAGTPIDFVIDGGKIQGFLSMTPDMYFENVIRHNGGLWPGEKQLMGFKALNPVDHYLGTYMDLQRAVMSGDDKAVEKWIRNNSWYETTYDLPGRMIREVIGDLFRANKLVKGELAVGGRTVDLGAITCPVVAITGDDDDITLERQCTALLEHSGASAKTHRRIPDCGHIAIYLKKEAMEVWREVMGDLAGLDQPFHEWITENRL